MAAFGASFIRVSDVSLRLEFGSYFSSSSDRLSPTEDDEVAIGGVGWEVSAEARGSGLEELTVALGTVALVSMGVGLVEEASHLSVVGSPASGCFL